MTTPPDALRATYDRWREAGYLPQPSFAWRPESWRKRLQSTDILKAEFTLTDCIQTIVERTAQPEDGSRPQIDRELVRSLHSPETLVVDGTYDEQAVVTAFLASMIWGYGTTGYGPYRTARVLTSDPCAIAHLTETAERAQASADGGIDAFDHIAGSRKNTPYLKYLGPAFGTKFLYFLTAASSTARTTPVMDAVVRRWFRTHAGINLVTWRWEKGRYRTYLEALDAWKGEFTREDGTPFERDDVELLIFSHSRGDDEVWDSAPVALSTDALLDLLQGDIDQIADRIDSPDGPALLQQLADWVARSGATDS